ncbi:MAG TPA: AzlD domain-containing protein [Ktedonobacteraceae bacterium]|jgi:branched-subunit amino acid transport protein|nr:AzlD domain-containing protein [Ktedonobacteraceae bacterium]
MITWLLIIGIGLATYAIRLSFITIFGKREIPAFVLRMLRFVPMAVLSAIIWPQLFILNNTLDLSLTNPRWIAGLLAVLVAWRTRNVLLTIAVGMVALWLLQWGLSWL